MSMIVVDPLRKLEYKGQVYLVESLYVEAAAGNDRLLLAAITGKRIRVLGGIVQSGAAAVCDALFKSTTGASGYRWRVTAPSNAVGPVQLPFNELGYFETVTGEGLYVDVGTSTGYFSLNYISYTP